MKKIASVLVALLLGALTICVRPDPALADSGGLTKDQVSTMVATWNKWGVTKETQDHLLTKLRQNEPWDSLRGVAPVAKKEFVHNERAVTVSTYPDGSISILEIDLPRDAADDRGPSPQSIHRCTVAGGSYWYQYSDCAATWHLVVYGFEFYFSYAGSGTHSTILDYHGIAGWVIGGSMGAGSLTKVNSTTVRVIQAFTMAGAAGWTACREVRVRGRSAHEVYC
ncbi:MAG: hypothetical protein Q4G45_02180 [Actinomycetia bacterium]|nr:hypothetical protein [Actinomycetes bacterium]